MIFNIDDMELLDDWAAAQYCHLSRHSTGAQCPPTLDNGESCGGLNQGSSTVQTQEGVFILQGLATLHHYNAMLAQYLIEWHYIHHYIHIKSLAWHAIHANKTLNHAALLHRAL